MYAHVGVQPTYDDAYRIKWLEGHREGVKKLFSTLLMDTKRRTRYPRETKPLFPRRMKAKEAISLIRDRHPAIAHLFGAGLGLEWMFRESEIMVDLLLEMKTMNIPALPIHDALLVPPGAEDAAMSVMRETFNRHTGVNCTVAVQHHDQTEDAEGEELL